MDCSKTIFFRDGCFAFRMQRLGLGQYLLVADDERLDCARFLPILKRLYKVTVLPNQGEHRRRFRLHLLPSGWSECHGEIIATMMYYYTLCLKEVQSEFVRPNSYLMVNN